MDLCLILMFFINYAKLKREIVVTKLMFLRKIAKTFFGKKRFPIIGFISICKFLCKFLLRKI